MLYWVRTPQWLQRIFPGFWWRLSANDPPMLYLTFDDGPHPEVTPQVLELLEQFEAKATFFCLGNNVEQHPAIYRKVLQKGHATGNHTYRHSNGWQMSSQRYVQEVAQAEHYIQSTLFRPPYGRIFPHQARALRRRGYHIVMFDVLSGDFDTRLRAEQCAQNVIENAEPGSIVVFHDSAKAWPRLQHCLPAVLEHFAERGYRFAHLPNH